MKILVADDEPMVQRVVSRLLEVLGHQVTMVSDGNKALSALKDDLDIQLAILDESMPGLTGSQVLMRLREFRKELPVFLTSGLPTEACEDKHVMHLPKPYRLEVLEDALDRLEQANAAKARHA